MRSFLITLMLMIPAFAMQAQEFNYDESKVPSYTLPDALTTLKGKKVKTVKQWEKVRRPELLDLFETEMFGKMPGRPADLHFKVLTEDKNALNGTATRKEVAMYFDKEERRQELR